MFGDSIADSDKWMCSGGKDPRSMKQKEYLEEFSKSTCSPIFIIPCMVSTRLVIMMDLDKAKTNYPHVVKACGWDTFLSNGKREIQIYPPDWTFMAKFAATPHLIKGCISTLLTPQMEIIDGKSFYYKKEGMEMRPQYEGRTSEFYRDDRKKCGWRSINNIVNGPGLTNGFPYLVHWQEDLEKLGYRTNLSMQIFPYDWRLDPKYIVEHYKFKEAAENLYALTGKKMLVSTHSYGINAGYEGMLLFSKTEREKYFSGFVSIGGPWLGAGDPLSYLLGLNGVDFGVVEMNVDDVMGNLPVLYTLTGKDTYERFKDTTWIKKTLLLKDYYHRRTTEKPFKFMPDRDTMCSDSLYHKQKSTNSKIVNQCTIGLENYDTLATVDDRTWKMSEAQEFLKKYGVGKNPEEWFKLFNTHDTSSFQNMNIPTYIFLADNMSTAYYNKYSQLEKPQGNRKLSQPKESIYTAGDGTVPLISQLGPGIKWAEEFENKVPGAKPIKFIHYCNSLHNRANGTYKELYTDVAWHKELLDQTKNSYLDLDCACSNNMVVKAGETFSDKAYMMCGHVGAFQDPPVRNFVLNLLKNGQKTDGISEFAKSIDDKYLAQLDDTCMFEKPSFLADWRNNYTKKNEEFFKHESAFWRRLRKRMLKINKN